MKIAFGVIFAKVINHSDQITICSYKRGQVNIESSVPLGLPGETKNDSEDAIGDMGSVSYWTTKLIFPPEVEASVRKSASREAIKAAAQLDVYNVYHREDRDGGAITWEIGLSRPETDG